MKRSDSGELSSARSAGHVKRNDPRYKLAQVSEALTRICRLISGLRLHSGEWTVDQSAQFFEREAHLPAPAARQEATRGTYDPTYGGFTSSASSPR